MPCLREKTIYKIKLVINDKINIGKINNIFNFKLIFALAIIIVLPKIPINCKQRTYNNTYILSELVKKLGLKISTLLLFWEKLYIKLSIGLHNTSGTINIPPKIHNHIFCIFDNIFFKNTFNNNYPIVNFILKFYYWDSLIITLFKNSKTAHKNLKIILLFPATELAYLSFQP